MIRPFIEPIYPSSTFPIYLTLHSFYFSFLPSLPIHLPKISFSPLSTYRKGKK